jgi:hypothetical protein
MLVSESLSREQKNSMLKEGLLYLFNLRGLERLGEITPLNAPPYRGSKWTDFHRITPFNFFIVY